MELAIRRELGCEPRKFKTVRGAMLWLSEERAKRLRMEQPYEAGATPRSLEARDRANATYGDLVRCMNPVDLPLIWVLPEWHRGWTPRKELAQDLGLSEYTLRKAMRFTEGKVKSRLEDAGLLEAA